jgi:hypothetical protein
MGTPMYVLSAIPLATTRFPNFFESGPESMMACLERPGGFRRGGWDLGTGGQARIVGGEYLEVASGSEKVIHLYEDGTLLFRAEADSFLAWPLDPDKFKQRPRLNTLGIIEVTAAFVHFYRRLLPRLERDPGRVRFRIEMVDASVEGKKLYVVPYPVLSLGWQWDDEKYPIAEDHRRKDEEATTSEVQQDPDHVAYRLVERLFLFFGVPSDKIPYAKQEELKRIDVASFSKQ